MNQEEKKMVSQGNYGPKNSIQKPQLERGASDKGFSSKVNSTQEDFAGFGNNSDINAARVFLRPATTPEYNSIIPADGDGDVLPEFYTLSFLEKKFADSSHLAAMDSTVASSPSIQFNNRSAKTRHEDVQRKKRIQPSHEKAPKLDIPERVLINMRISERPPFSRGLMVPRPGGTYYR